MEVSRIRQIPKVKVLVDHLEHCSGIGKDVPCPRVGQDNGEARRGPALRVYDAFKVDASLFQTRQGELPKRIPANASYKSDSSPHHGQVVSADGRRAAKGQQTALGEQLAFCRQLFGQAIQDQVQINFAGKGDIELGQACS